ncbi:hypothetical protein ABPG75_007987 [Micractinium tetrahymenae]
MPAREPYEREDGQAHTSAQTLLTMLGGAKNLTSGFSVFAIKTLAISWSAATVFGMSSYMLFHGPLGPALSFMAGSGFGFVGGLVSRWRSDTAEALLMVDRFPALMEHHVRMNSDGGRLLNCGQTFGEWAADLPRNPRKQGIVIAAMYSAAPALERIRQEQEDAVVAAYAAREAERAAGKVDTAIGEHDD